MAGAFDVAVIGGGPGGYVAALRAAQLGARTAIVEKDRMGGTCLVRGCIPTKALLQSSELYTMAREGAAFGLVADNVGFDWSAAQKRKGSVVDQLVKGVEGLLKAGGVTSYKGSARLAGKGLVDVAGDQLQAKDIVIATGSAMARIQLPGAELTIDSDQILELKEVPRRLAVIGGGVVGMEFAAMFAALGSKVTVLEMLPQVLAMVDADLVAVYSKHLSKVGGEIHTDSKVSEVVKHNGALQVRFSTGGEGGAVDADQVLLAVGRTPYTQGLDAEKAGVKLDRGRVVVDDHLRTSADGVWAIVKVIADAESGKLLGAHIIGPRATDLIAEATLAIQNGLTLEQIDLTIHAHPTLPESLMEAALAAQGRAIHIANRKSNAPTGAFGATSPASGEVKNLQNREKNMVAPVKPSSPPPAPSAIDPKALELTKGNREFLLGLHRQMQLIRRFEERAQEQYTKAKIGGYCHLNIGEEATVVGGILALQANDWIFTSYREHGHAIARGVDPKAVMAELFGKETGTSHGRGGSMHLVDYSRRFMGGYGIVGGHLPLAVGGAWAVKYRKQPDVIFCMFGDGATNIGAFHESLNMAKVFDLPVVWFCVNNRYGMGTPVEKASAVTDIYKKACAYDMESIQIDGMNLPEVMLRTSQIVEKTRKDSVPRFIESLCYRFRGHSVVDPDKYRSAEDKEKYRKADPIVAFEHELEKSGLADEEYFKSVRQEIDAEVRDIIEYADQSPDPNPDDLYKYTYAGEWADRPELRADRV